MHICCNPGIPWGELIAAISALSSEGLIPVPCLERLLAVYRQCWVELLGQPHVPWMQASSSLWPYSLTNLNPTVTIIQWWTAGVPGMWSVTGLENNSQIGKITTWISPFSATQPSSSTVPKTEDQRPQLGGCHFVWIMFGCDRVCWTWSEGHLSPTNQKPIVRSNSVHEWDFQLVTSNSLDLRMSWLYIWILDRVSHAY